MNTTRAQHVFQVVCCARPCKRKFRAERLIFLIALHGVHTTDLLRVEQNSKFISTSSFSVAYPA